MEKICSVCGGPSQIEIEGNSFCSNDCDSKFVIKKMIKTNIIEEDNNPTPEGVCAICSTDMYLEKKGMLHLKEKSLCLKCANTVFFSIEKYIEMGMAILIKDHNELKAVSFTVPSEKYYV
tara:strand:- start:442 stop:801 length:360 start_codon:yes stop_codon:yes gene_type:complete